MYQAIVVDGVVVDIIVADSAFIAAKGDEVKAARGFPGGSWVEVTSETKIGDAV